MLEKAIRSFFFDGKLIGISKNINNKQALKVNKLIKEFDSNVKQKFLENLRKEVSKVEVKEKQ